jgi:DNA-binding GntR family transcriptional regulator
MAAALARTLEMKPRDRWMLADHVYETLRGRILDRHIEPESWMAIDALARDLNVSQTPVREAMARLESDGLVSKQENGRYRTEPLLTTTSFNHLFDVRLQLEPFAAAEAARHIRVGELDELRAVAASMRYAPTGTVYAKFAEFTNGNATFHRLIALASRNELLAEAIQRLHSHHRLAQLYLHHGIVDAAPALQEHAAIVDAVAAGDDGAAAALMRAHIERSRGELAGLIGSILPAREAGNASI